METTAGEIFGRHSQLILDWVGSVPMSNPDWVGVVLLGVGISWTDLAELPGTALNSVKNFNL